MYSLDIEQWRHRANWFFNNGRQFCLKNSDINSHSCQREVEHTSPLLYRKWSTERWTAECMASGSGWQIHYCFECGSKQSKCCFGEWAVTVPAPRHHHTININKREGVRCLQGDCKRGTWIRNVTDKFGKWRAGLRHGILFIPAWNKFYLEGDNSQW